MPSQAVALVPSSLTVKDVAGGFDGVIERAGGGLERAVALHYDGVAVAVLQRDGQVLTVDGQAATVHKVQLAGDEIRLGDGDGDGGEAAKVVADFCGVV